MSEILRTRDYSIFKKHPQNRELKPLNLKKLEESLGEKSLLEFRPILVDKDMRVLDGQHCVRVAEKLGIEVFYMIVPDAQVEDIIRLNAYKQNWATDDYMNAHSSLGKAEYIKLNEFCNRNQISIAEFLHMMNIRHGSQIKKLKKGEVILPPQQTLDEFEKKLIKLNDLCSLIDSYSIKYNYITKTQRFRRAAYILLSNKNTDYKTLLKKIKFNFDKIRPSTTSKTYYSMLRDIYNYKNQNPID
jgi:hypothetical protein